MSGICNCITVQYEATETVSLILEEWSLWNWKLVKTTQQCWSLVGTPRKAAAAVGCFCWLSAANCWIHLENLYNGWLFVHCYASNISRKANSLTLMFQGRCSYNGMCGEDHQEGLVPSTYRRETERRRHNSSAEGNNPVLYLCCPAV